MIDSCDAEDVKLRTNPNLCKIVDYMPLVCQCERIKFMMDWTVWDRYKKAPNSLPQGRTIFASAKIDDRLTMATESEECTSHTERDTN